MPIIRDDQQGKLVKSPPRRKTATTAVPPVPRRTTRSASLGDPHVATVQRQLRAAGINVAVDGVYGPQTDAAIRRYNAGLAQRNADARHATANVIKTQVTEPRQAAAPIMVPRSNTAKLQPGKAPTTRRSYTPFYPGQKPDYHERTRTAGRGPAAGKRRAVYTLPQAQQMTGLEWAAGHTDNPLAALAATQAIRTDARGGAFGSAVRGVLEEAPAPHPPPQALRAGRRERRPPARAHAT
jgi:peptidoglycan hydrolase-like protein with peptidoglycan-binding domain